MEKSILTPKEIAQSSISVAENKANMVWWRQFLLAIMAGLFIGLAGNGASITAYSVPAAGMSKMLSGVLFGTGLILVLMAGAELFTGNSLMLIGVAEKKIRISAMLRNWVIVYIGNFIGGVGLAWCISQTTQFGMDKGALGAYAINTALSKCTLDFKAAFIMAVFCNILVCLAVWVSWAGKDMVSKIIGLYFPIWLHPRIRYLPVNSFWIISGDMNMPAIPVPSMSISNVSVRKSKTIRPGHFPLYGALVINLNSRNN